MISCQQPQVVTDLPIQQKGPQLTITNGRFVLNSEEDFLKTIDQLKILSTTELTNWDKGNDFTSLQEFYDQHPEGFMLGNDNPTFKSQAGDKPFIGDFLTTRLLNEAGEIQIGQQVYTFLTDGKRLKTDASVFDHTPKAKLAAVSSESEYTIKVVGGQQMTSPNAKSAVPDLPIGGTEMIFDSDHIAMGFFSQSGVWPFYTSFALKNKMQERSGWWIFKTWGSTNANHLDIQNGRLQLTGSEGTNVLDNYNLNASCDNCSEASVYAGYVPFSFGGTVNQIQGTFNATYNGVSKTRYLY